MELSIVATGASLKGKDLTKIPKPIMAINYAFKYVDYDYLAAFDDPKVHGFPVDDRLHTNYDWVHKYNLKCHGWNRKRRRISLGRFQASADKETQIVRGFVRS